MNIYIKQAIVVTLLVLASNQVLAKNTQNDGDRPSRPTFESIDSNSDGDIDFDEFSSQELPHGDHQTVFDEIDTDNNGVISNEEFTNHKPPRPQNRKGNS
ncbi:EF-hand domain-containing protein [Colwellia sp. 4_MG-2023]|uniref:EF-hand domain-containing protein n=1 Tax=unclassified Colwellia TaxID=196834 RepID=UPI001C095E94|nr:MULTISPECIES: EF-hand domain-containing protein [unclassified Colwellia]MBU2925944.1 EF-hand domain-containing protein [Colwellia sp. C2M11]MDO6507429.1 EF-hand domain-containing protein [Colwellia sp. 5_MG-2023]MDO6556151.1 EF-hand domain-containing protein [Colwellia sp. 4_MG-2023]MDO6652658.1 EF-hand domain-containing protein [Colwellia sp. 3_MG-2023]MDO6665533.1 EF-hand domain-containing protein [Colwellia sp. 2_MG-2023]